MTVCFIGIGSNLGNRYKNIKRALTQLSKVRGVKINKISRLYSTSPEGIKNQPDFLNGVIRLGVDISPQRLLTNLKSIEKKLGRKKTIRFGPRVIDLDILFFGSERIKTKTLTIPHPRMFRRNFVLKPLSDVAPEMFRPKIIKNIDRMRAFVRNARIEGKTIGFVPTMGYLHVGHLSLIRQAKNDCDKVIVSIFVNPAQFGPKEDFSRYPKDFRRDMLLLKQIGVDAVFYPAAKQIYPKGYLTHVDVEEITSGLCGMKRPNHFRGVATIVTKLFNIVAPDFAYFGQKDAQQTRVIEQMVCDLNMPVKIKIMPIVRETDGLAMSSRNKYLNKFQRNDAVVLFASLLYAKALIKKGERSSKTIISAISKKIKNKKTVRIEYVDIVDAQILNKVNKISGKVLIVIAAWFGKTRLIDNIIINSKFKTRNSK